MTTFTYSSNQFKICTYTHSYLAFSKHFRYTTKQYLFSCLGIKEELTDLHTRRHKDIDALLENTHDTKTAFIVNLCFSQYTHGIFNIICLLSEPFRITLAALI